MKTQILLIAGCMLSIGSFSQISSFYGLGDFAGGSYNSEAVSVSADGSLVAGNGTTANGTQAFIWTERSGIVELGNVTDNSFSSTYAKQISADGSTIVGSADSVVNGTYHDRQGFVWNATDGMKKIGSLNYSVKYRATAISNDGSTIAGFGGKEAFHWSESNGIKALGTINGKKYSRITAMSDDGSVAAGSCFNDSYSNEEPVMWSETNGMTGFVLLPGHTSGFVNSISSDGTVICGTSYSQDSAFAFRWTKETGMKNIGHLPGKNTMHPNSVTAKGDTIIGAGYNTNNYILQAYMWDSINGIRDLKTVLQTEYGLDLNGWTLNNACAITPNGKVIVGVGTNPSGNKEAFRVTLGTQVSSKDIKPENIDIYPNPAQNIIQIKPKDSFLQDSDYRISDLKGNVVKSGKLTTGQIDVSHISSGIYFLQLDNTKGTICRKVIIE